jgi:predicted RNase H-like HicB family nuclease
MPRYVALIDGKPGAYGFAFPDAPGCAAMGDTIEHVLPNARKASSERI